MSANEIANIRDDGIRKIVQVHLTTAGIEVRSTQPKRGRPKIYFADVHTGREATPRQVQEVLGRVAMPSGVPVKKARVIVANETVRELRCAAAAMSGDPSQIAYVEPASNHHLAIFEWSHNGKRKREAVFVTMLEAMNRVKRHEPIIQRTPPANHPTVPDDARFLFSLSSGELVLANWKGEQKLLVFKTAASTQGQIYFAEHTDARRSTEQAKFVAKANTLDARKVTVDPLGRIRWAND